ncbi:hypothetical protein HU762_24605 [Pseudomonas sp. SWRI92]|uniref:Uncharacterized protein n=1 Tax=Pseudomonas marvdashtae TaxID=2745500 RepID=A0A923FN56_9PSED|nr:MULTISPECIES: hypothetical protein [Pseudomonas]MBC3377126.1 hypothetical protein [Pseudomonas sp. SWRI92]MBV4552575.1 hypothetical protein [Pseudomonas marvdashtae]
MLIGHRFERTARDDLHIHSINRVQSGFVLLTSAMALIFPVAAVLAIATADSPLASVDPLASLLTVLGLLLIPAAGLLLLIYSGTHETLLLSRLDAEGKRRTRNFFGRRERVHSVFRIDAAKYLELRRRPEAEPARTQLWLVLRDGTEHRLTTDNVPVTPGRKHTDMWLNELADYLKVTVPTEVVMGSATGAPAAYRPAPTPAKIARQRKTKTPMPCADTSDRLGIPARALLALLGTFLAVFELTRIIALMSALFTGRLRIGISRPTTFYWTEQPMAFSFHVLIGIAELLVIGVIAWGCLRVAIQGRMKSDPG